MTQTFENVRADAEDFESQLSRTLTQIGETYSTKDLKASAIRQAATQGVDPVSLEKVAEYRFVLPGKIAILLEGGAVLSDRLLSRFAAKVTELADEGYQVKKVEEAPRVRIVPDDPVAITADIAIDNAIRGDSGEELAELLDQSGLTLQGYGGVLDRINTELSDYEARDEQAQEMVELMGDRAQATMTALRELKTIVQMFQENKKAERRGTRKRTGYDAKKAVKTAKNANYRKVDTRYKIVSIPADEIVGAKALLVFNTKNRRIGLYRAPEGETLGIKGTTIQNFDTEQSISRIIRDTDRDLPRFRQANRLRRAEVLFEDLKGVTHKMTGRINADTVLLRAYK